MYVAINLADPVYSIYYCISVITTAIMITYNFMIHHFDHQQQQKNEFEIYSRKWDCKWLSDIYATNLKHEK